MIKVLNKLAELGVPEIRISFQAINYSFNNDEFKITLLKLIRECSFSIIRVYILPLIHKGIIGGLVVIFVLAK